MKNITELFFVLNKNERIIIQLPVSIDIISACDDVIIKFIHNDNNIMLANDCFLHVLRQFKNMLQSALDNKLSLHSSITKDIGYLWNNVLKGNKSSLTFIKNENQDVWIGEQYLLWSTSSKANPNVSTWLYNDVDGSIIFHITPNLKDIFTISQKEFDTLMQSYASLLITTIPQDIASTWLKQTEKILKTIEKTL